jgi:hypothetical protein
MSDHVINGTLLVSTPCELANRSVDDCQEGSQAFVTTTGQYFRMSRETPALTPDGATVLTTWGGPAMAPCTQSYTGTGNERWILQNNGDVINPFASVTDWYIDPIAGLDTNSGTILSSPLKTFKALAARWANITTLNTAAINVHVIGAATALATGDQAVLTRPINPNFPLSINGVQTTLTTNGIGGVLAYTPINRAGNVSSQLQGLLLAGTWTTYIGKIVVITTAGANLGAWAVVLEDLGGDTCKTTPFVKQTTDTTVALTTVSPAPGDTFKVVSVLELNDGSIGCYPLINTGSGDVWFHDVSFDDAGGAGSSYSDGILSAGHVYVYRSQLNATGRGLTCLSLAALRWGGCYLVSQPGTTALGALTATFDFEGCGWRLGGQLSILSGFVIIDGDTALFPNNQFIGIIASSIVLCHVHIDKALSPAIDLPYTAGAGRASQAAFSGAIYGTAIPTTHISLHDYCRATYTGGATFPAAVTGGQHPLDFQNGVLKDYADLPFISIATNSDSQAGLLLAK